MVITVVVIIEGIREVPKAAEEAVAEEGIREVPKVAEEAAPVLGGIILLSLIQNVELVIFG